MIELNGYVCKDIVSIEEVFKHFSTSIKIKFGEESCRVESLRIQTFKEKGITCATCGIKGKFFVVSANRKKKGSSNNWHLSLVAEKNGKYVLMTKDHVLAKSKGGPDHISNMQTMCTVCNYEKGCD
jgi:5-methylcytosine-specific restriction endonuclease McrA